MNFLPNLEDTQENLIEKIRCIQCWSWNVKKKSNDKDSTHLPLSVQCEGITIKGENCKLNTLNESKLCHLYNTKVEIIKKIHTAVILTKVVTKVQHQ